VAGVIIFDPNRAEIGFSTGSEVAVGAYNDIENDALYFTDGSTIYQWESNAAAQQTYVWKSSKIRMRNPVNIGAAIVEAESYNDVVFKLYADGVLKATKTVPDGEPFRLPGGYLSNIYEAELTGTDVITRVSVGESIWDFGGG